MKRCLGATLLILAAPYASAQRTLLVSQTSPSPTPPFATWDTAAHTIQEAVDTASDGDTVLVAAGEYPLTNQVAIAKAIHLRSVMGAGQTSLDGQWLTRCLWISNSVAVVDGFTMTRGHETDDGDLGGVVVMVGGVLSNCIVKRPPSPFYEGRLVHCSSGGLITDCQIGPNSGVAAKGGGVYLTDSELRNCIISGMLYGPAYGGADDGAGVYAVSSTISGCTIAASYARRAGGGAYLDGCLMDRCIIASNRAGVYLITAGLGGGIFATNSVIRNSLVAANVADAGYDPETNTDGGLPGFGGGVYLQGSSLLSCTVTGNRTVPPSGAEPSRGGGLYVESGNVRNSTIYFNSAPTNANWYNGGGSFDHACTTPNPGGVGNIVTDPQFVDPSNGNYRLAPASPCIDAGTNEDPRLGDTDLDGKPRIVNGAVDLGAWESQTMNTAPLARVNVENSVTFLNIPTVITLNSSSGTVILDGSRSSDAENDPLTCSWSVGDPPETFATSPRVTAQVPLGSYVFQLRVSDGKMTAAASASVAVLTPCNAIAFLNLRIEESSHPKALRPLGDLLTKSCRSFDKGKVSKGIEDLKAFQVKAAEKPREVDRAFAEVLIHEAQTLIDAIPTK